VKTPLIPNWLRWSLLALFSWGVWAIMAKLIGDALAGAHNQALSTLGILPVMLAMAFTKRCSTAGGNRRRGILLALAAGAISCLGNVVYYDALSRGGKAAMIVPLTALYPLATIFLATLLLKEQLNRVQIIGALVSLTAIYFFNVPSESDGFFSPWLLLALVPIGLWGASGFLQKLSTNHISGELSTLWFLGAFIPFGVFFLAQQPLPDVITTKTWLLVVGQGFFLALGNFAVLAAFADGGRASIITPLAALYPVVSVPIAIGFLGEHIAPREAIGIVLALVSVVALSYETPSTTPPRSVASATPT